MSTSTTSLPNNITMSQGCYERDNVSTQVSKHNPTHSSKALDYRSASLKEMLDDLDALQGSSTAPAPPVSKGAERGPVLYNQCGPPWLKPEEREKYPRTKQPRCNIKYLDWNISDPDYKPLHYTRNECLDNPPAGFKRAIECDYEDYGLYEYNKYDGVKGIDRESYTGRYQIDARGRPLNPLGRTGIEGNGLLFYGGPNKAADPIVATYIRDENGQIALTKDYLPRAKFVSIFRDKDFEWAIPGGMRQPGTSVSKTLIAEFGEEALATLEKTPENRKKAEEEVGKFFQNGIVIFKGQVKDPRNTDNAWIETDAELFFDETGETTGKFKLKAGDDAIKVQWTEITPDLKLFASHKDFILLAYEEIVRIYKRTHA